MSGYAGQVIRLTFPELSEDPATDPIWVVIKNPKLQPEAALRPADPAAFETDEQGKLKNQDAASAAGRESAARLVIAWRVYDATTSPQFDPQTGEQVPGTGQVLLPPPSGGNGVPPEQIAKLPTAITIKIMNTITEAINPQRGQDGPTAKTSSGPLNPSTTEPGPGTPPPLS